MPTCLNVGVSVDEFHAFLKAPEATLGTLEEGLEYVEHGPCAAALLPVLDVVLNVLEDDPDHLDDCNDQGAKGSGAKVEADESIKGGDHGGHPHVSFVPRNRKYILPGNGWWCTYVEKYQPATLPAMTRC